MSETEEKHYISIKFESDISICCACLSSDRNLFCIDEYADILFNIVNNSIKVSQNMLLCWECTSILKTIKLFKSRVEKAQKILSYGFMHKKECVPQSLSRLSKASSVPEDIILINHNENYELTIKHEVNESEDEKIYFDIESLGDQCPVDKKEHKPASKAKVRNFSRRSLYRIVYGPNIFKKSLLRKKFAIKPEEIALWLERDKTSKLYKNVKFRCTKCFEGYNSKEKLDRHYLASHEETLGPHVCSTCNARFPSLRALEPHVQGHLVARSCTRCEFSCYTLRLLNAHIVRSHRQVQCLCCTLCLPSVKEFRQHYREMHSVFLCDLCGKGRKTKYLLEKHIMRSHAPTHKCGQCERTYASGAALRKHAAYKHAAPAPDQAYCVRCDKQFSSEPVYRRHLLNSTAHAHETDKLSKRVPCPECDNTYSRRTYMMNHFRYVHANQSKHYCARCDRHFLNRTRYVEHMRYNHEGAKKEKNKLCNVCGRGFATNRTLVNHIRTHSGERPFECTHCAARFTQKHSMLSHVKYLHLKNKRRAPWQTSALQ